jgi:hypothetical protein
LSALFAARWVFLVAVLALAALLAWAALTEPGEKD